MPFDWNLLTPAELEITKLIARGESSKFIATERAISTETVKRHISNIFDKAGASNRTEIAIWYATRDTIPGAVVDELRGEISRLQYENMLLRRQVRHTERNK